MATGQKSLELLFLQERGESFLLGASIKTGRRVEHLDTRTGPFEGKEISLRALCILILLAKHRHERCGDAEPCFIAHRNSQVNQGRGDSKNWVYSLAGFLKDANAWDTVRDFFGTERHFFEARIASTRIKQNQTYGKTYARFINHLLPLDSIVIRVSSSDRAPKRRLALDELPKVATDIEQYWVKRGAWRLLVGTHVAETLAMPKKTSTKERKRFSKAVIRRADMFFVKSWKSTLALKGIVGRKIKAKLQNHRDLKYWYVVSRFADEFAEWNDYFLQAAEKGVNLCWIDQDFNCVSQNRHMSVQWFQALGSNQSLDDPGVMVREKRSSSFRILVELAYKFWCGNRSSGFSYGSTKVPHSFTGFFAINAPVSDLSNRKEPLRGFGIVSPFGMLPSSIERSAGLFLQADNSLLRAYLESIATFCNGTKELSKAGFAREERCLWQDDLYTCHRDYFDHTTLSGSD